MTVHRASRPFGIVLSFDLAQNSLDSLSINWNELNHEIHDVNYFVNFVVVLGEGLLRFEQANLTRGEKFLLMGTDEFINLIQTAQKRRRNGEQQDEIVIRIVNEAIKDQTFGRFFFYLLVLLSRMKLNVPDLGQYLDPGFPLTVVREVVAMAKIEPNEQCPCGSGRPFKECHGPKGTFAI